MRKLMLAAAALIGLTSVANAKLSSADQSIIGAHFNKCMPDTTAPDGIPALAMLVRINESGVARRVSVDSVDPKQFDNPIYRAYGEKIIRGILSPQCATVPFLESAHGQVTEFKLRFNVAQVTQRQPSNAEDSDKEVRAANCAADPNCKVGQKENPIRELTEHVRLANDAEKCPDVPKSIIMRARMAAMQRAYWKGMPKVDIDNALNNRETYGFNCATLAGAINHAILMDEWRRN